MKKRSVAGRRYVYPQSTRSRDDRAVADDLYFTHEFVRWMINVQGNSSKNSYSAFKIYSGSIYESVVLDMVSCIKDTTS